MNLLLSYPRSGNTWFRYCIEFLTKKPTQGYLGPLSAKFDNHPLGKFVNLGVDMSLDNIMIKRHAVEEIDKPIEKLILIVRDYKEVIIRHKKKEPSISLLKESCSSEKSSNNYIQIIEYYDNFDGDKIIIYYEDIIKDLKPTLKKVLDFLEEDDKHLNELIKDFNKHKGQSIGIYGNSETKGGSIKFHSNKMDKKEKVRWDNFIKTTYPDLFEKYLKIYEEK